MGICANTHFCTRCFTRVRRPETGRLFLARCRLPNEHVHASFVASAPHTLKPVTHLPSPQRTAICFSHMSLHSELQQDICCCCCLLSHTITRIIHRVSHPLFFSCLSSLSFLLLLPFAPHSLCLSLTPSLFILSLLPTRLSLPIRVSHSVSPLSLLFCPVLVLPLFFCFSRMRLAPPS